MRAALVVMLAAAPAVAGQGAVPRTLLPPPFAMPNPHIAEDLVTASVSQSAHDQSVGAAWERSAGWFHITTALALGVLREPPVYAPPPPDRASKQQLPSYGTADSSWLHAGLALGLAIPTLDTGSAHLAILARASGEIVTLDTGRPPIRLGAEGGLSFGIDVLPNVELRAVATVDRNLTHVVNTLTDPSWGVRAGVLAGIGLEDPAPALEPLSVLMLGIAHERGVGAHERPASWYVSLGMVYGDDGAWRPPAEQVDFVVNADGSVTAAASEPVPPAAPEPAIADSDGDGLADPADVCPAEPEDRDEFQDEDGCPDPDNDGDAVPDISDQCPALAGPPDNGGCPDADGDGDGLPDRADMCPEEAEDRDGFQDEDGCPDPDNDADGVPDAQDGCPLSPEDRDGFADDDGCPDIDNDGDGLADGVDACPTAAEDKDGVADHDGCPETDHDGDQVPDGDDKCPTEPETWDGVDDADGCPETSKRASLVFAPGRVEVGEVKLLKSGSFAAATAKLLETAVSILKRNERLTRVRVTGVPLKQAEAVRWYLLGKGFARDRVEMAPVDGKGGKLVLEIVEGEDAR